MNVDFSRPILAIDTSTSYLSLAIFAKEQMWTFHEAVGTKQSTLILPTLDRLLADTGLARSDIASIVYAQGPGAFTGLRIGLGVAQGLALPEALVEAKRFIHLGIVHDLHLGHGHGPTNHFAYQQQKGECEVDCVWA